MPNNHVIENVNVKNFDEYFNNLSKNSRRHFKRNIFPYEDCFEVNYITQASEQEIDHWYDLYMNVKQKNLEINTFSLPKKIFRLFIERNDIWDIMTLTLKAEHDNSETRKPVLVLFSSKNKKSYSPMIIGIDYRYNKLFGCYRQAHYQAIKRAISLKCEQIRLGYSASIEKQRLGAVSTPTILFADNKDNFSMEALAII